MQFLKRLLGLQNAEKQVQLIQGYCPNCWGDQEYENIVREKFKDPQIDINNKEANYAFIKDFVVTHLDGIKLKSMGNGVGCPRCKLTQKPS